MMMDCDYEVKDCVAETEEIIYRPAGVGIRFWAYLIDLIVILAFINLFISHSLESMALNLAFVGIGLSSFGVLASLYFLLMTKIFGQTIGKMIVGIRVIGTDGAPPDWSSLIFREVIGRFIAQLAGTHLGYLSLIHI